MVEEVFHFSDHVEGRYLEAGVELIFYIHVRPDRLGIAAKLSGFRIRAI